MGKVLVRANWKSWRCQSPPLLKKATIMLMTVFVIAEFIGIICFVTAVLDMGMNGGRYAYWAPWGLGICLLCGGAMWVTDPVESAPWTIEASMKAADDPMVRLAMPCLMLGGGKDCFQKPTGH
jgi:cytochrome bd-type quinol oxidase subunit 1